MVESVSILILPGMDGTGYLLSEFIDRLSEKYQTKLISYPSDIVLNEDQLISYVETRLPNSKFVIIGESFSGPIATQIAFQNAQNVIGLILVSSFIKRPVPAFLSLFARVIPIKYIPSFITTWLLLGKNVNAENKLILHKALSTVSDDVLFCRILTLLNFNKVQEATFVKCPVLYVVGKNDRILSNRTIQFTKQSFKKCTLVEVDGPHMLLNTHSKAAANAVENFISKLKI